MQPATLDDYVGSVGRCATIDDLMSVYRKEIASEGFQNLVIFRTGGPNGIEIPYLEMPDGFVSSYLAENFIDIDPVLAAVPQFARGFRWDDLMRRSDVSKPARDMMGACGELGVRSGVTMIFHGPDGRSDCFSLSCRDKRTTDKVRMEIINLKTYSTWLRFTAIEAISHLRGFGTSAAIEPNSLSPAHSDGPLSINEQECRALVIAQTAYRRYRAGLIELSDSLPDILGPDMFDRLQRRGLIYDEPDDLRWRYYTKPSPIAHAHLNTCGAVTSVRNEIWQLHVRGNERPVVMG